MKCQILFSGKKKNNIMNLLSAEFAKRVIKVYNILTSYQELYLRVEDNL